MTIFGSRRHRENRMDDGDQTAKALDLVTGFYYHIPDVVASLRRRFTCSG